MKALIEWGCRAWTLHTENSENTSENTENTKHLLAEKVFRFIAIQAYKVVLKQSK